MTADLYFIHRCGNRGGYGQLDGANQSSLCQEENFEKNVADNQEIEFVHSILNADVTLRAGAGVKRVDQVGWGSELDQIGDRERGERIDYEARVRYIGNNCETAVSTTTAATADFLSSEESRCTDSHCTDSSEESRCTDSLVSTVSTSVAAAPVLVLVVFLVLILLQFSGVLMGLSTAVSLSTDSTDILLIFY